MSESSTHMNLVAATVQWIAQSRFQCCSFQANRTHISIGKAVHTCIFFTKTDTTRQEHLWRTKFHPTKLYRQFIF